MSDEELLKTAEDLLHFGQPRLPADNYIQMSIAASLLVIARNSLSQARLISFPDDKLDFRESPDGFKERNRQ